MASVVANGIQLNAIRLAPAADRRWAPVVFLHGLIMDNLSSYYYTLAPGLSRDTDVVLYDLRGHGRSDRPPGGYTLDDSVEDLAQLLATLGIDEPVVLVGNSFGGTIALYTAMHRPDLVAGLGLIEAHPVVEGWGDELMADLEDMVAGFDEPGVRDFIGGDGGRRLKRMAATCEALVTQTSLTTDLRAEHLMTDDDLARIACPVLCLYGEATDIMDRAELLAGAIPGAELDILDGCTHSVLMEAPDELEVRLRAWLDRLVPASRAADRVH
jgi:pimeloyl-ACP methyl ester carboxylesterase